MRRLLPHDEYYKLALPIKQLFGGDKEVPSPEMAPLCAVEEDEAGNIKGFLFLQLAFHLEPFGSLDHASFSGLKQVIDSALTNIPSMLYYVHVNSPAGEAVGASNGFTVAGTLLIGHPKV